MLTHKLLAPTVVCVLLTASSASAADPWGGVTCDPAGNPGCDLVAGVSTGSADVGGNVSQDGREDAFACRYVPVDHVDPAIPRPDGPGGWFRLICSADGKNTASRPPVWLPAGQAGPALAPDQVAEIARSRLRLPDPAIAMNPPREQLVNLPTWLWLSDGWRPIAATASVPGVVVTAVAEPVAAVWSTGDGTTVTCSGPGSAFAVGRDPKGASPDCGHTFRRASAAQPAGTYRLSVTLRWNVRWSGAGQSGSFSDLTTNSSTALRVVESQALNSR
ncbi:hypothetical protein JNUCC0626_13900 [Lentzea sp. JNUCC 0626]|uniref:hypothetical protein n=1 Tax=Lentzea sp. JNUCC 0626 TaxID=3367513 RepID=UPI003749D484